MSYLMQAIISNNLIMVQNFLSNPENNLNSLNDVDLDDGHTALQRAAKEGHIEIMAALIAAGAEVDKGNHAGATALYVAAYENKLLALQYSLRHNASVDKATKSGTTPFMIAANQGNSQAMQLLLRAGANIDKKNNVNVTALFIAAQVGNFLGVKILLAHNANYDEQTPFGKAFEIASKGKHIVTVDLFNTFFANQINLQKEWQNTIEDETSNLLFSLDAKIKTLSLTPIASVKVQRNSIDAPINLSVCTSDASYNRRNFKISDVLWKAKPRSFEEMTYSAIPICLAAEGGVVDSIKLLLDWGVDVNATLSTGESALHFAASTGQIPAMQLLLDSGARVNLANNQEHTPFFIAARTGRVMALALLYKEKANIDQPSKFGNTPLMTALASNQTSVAYLLVEWGANVNHTNNKKSTPLITALTYADPIAIQVLLNAGAEIDYQDKNGMTALLHATRANQLDAIQLLINANANIALTDKTGKNALLYAVEIGNPEVVKTLLAYHSPNDYHQPQIDIVLKTATRLGRQAVIKVLKEYITDGAQQIHWQNQISENTELLLLKIEKKLYQLWLFKQILSDKNINALHTLVQHNHIPLMTEFLSHPFGLLTSETVNAHTPYHFAVQNGQNEALLFILEYFTSWREAVHFAKSHFYFAAQNGHIRAMRLFNCITENVDLVHGNGLTPLCIAAFQNHAEAVRYLLANGANVNFCSPLGTAMQIAERNNCIKVVDVLKKYFANRISVRQQWWQEIDDNSRQSFDDIITLLNPLNTRHTKNKLIYAIKHHDLAEVQRLLAWEFQSPRSINIRENFYNHNALDLASESGQVAIMKALIAAGANPHQVNKYGYSPLLEAVRNGHLEAARLLVESGVTVIPAPNEKNSLCAARHPELIQFLLDHGIDPNSAEEGKTAFYIRTSKNNVEGMLLLIHSNALIDKPDNEGNTPLIIAAKKGHIEAMRVLLAYQTNDNSIDLALKIAAENEHSAAVHFLNHFIENKSDLKSKWLLEFNEKKQNLVTLIRTKLKEKKETKNVNSLISATKVLDFIGVRHLLASEFDTPQKINEHEADGTTALHIACMQGDIRIMHTLIQAGAEVNKAKKNGMTPLNIAAEYGHAAACYLLILSNAEIDKPNTHNATPLYHAALNGHDQVVEVLLNAGASVDLATIHHLTPLIIATLQGHANIVRNLIAYQANLMNRSPFGTALEIANATKQTVIADLLSQGQYQHHQRHCEISLETQKLINQLTRVIDDSKCYAFKTTIFSKKLINAVKANNLANVLQLLKGKYKNRKYIQQELDDNGDTALHLAAKFGYSAILYALIKSNAIVDQLNHHGATPLYLAAQAGKMEAIQLLLNAGASVKSILPQMKTVLIAAVIQGRVDIVLTLLAYDADVNISAYIDSPLNYARIYAQKEILSLLQYFSNSANKEQLQILWRNNVNNQTEELLLQLENELTANALSLLTSQKTAVTPMESIQKTVSNEVLRGLQYQPVPGDGHCLFHAIGLHLGQDATFLRRFVATHLEKNFAMYKPYRQGTDDEFRSYIKAIREGREWGDNIEIDIIQRVTDRPIIIMRPNANPTIPDNLSAYKGEPIFIYFNDHNHYDSFILMDNANARNILTRIQTELVQGRTITYRPVTQFDAHSPPMLIRVEPTHTITDTTRKLIVPKKIQATPAIEFKTIAQSAIVVSKELGCGSSGRVMYGTLHEHLIVAVKELKSNLMSDVHKQHLLHEAKILANLRSPNIILLFGVCTTGPLRLVIEYMAGGTLSNLLYSRTKIDWEKRLKFAIDICRGLYYLSVQDPVILHRDLKSENILLDEHMCAKIADFGFADIKKDSILTSSSNKKVSSALGTPVNMAPELFLNQPKFSEASDLYAFSIILWEIASRSEPYRNIDVNLKLFMELIKFGTREEIPRQTPPKFSQLIVKCWDNRSNHRPPVKDVLVELQEIAVTIHKL